MGLGHTAEAVSYLDNMTRLEGGGQLVEDANEARWVVDSLQRIVNRDAPLEVKTRSEGLIKAINERLMSQYPLGVHVPVQDAGFWQDLHRADYMRDPAQDRQQPDNDKAEQRNEHDDMAATAGKLLESVADNTSDKFQNSQFLGLMRKLRDRELRVEEDKIVQVPKEYVERHQTLLPKGQQQPRPASDTSQIPQIPQIDPTILSHAAIDYALPTYDDEQRRKHPSSLMDYTEAIIQLEKQNQGRLAMARQKHPTPAE